MTVKYWWTEDGGVELCGRKEGVLEVGTECYHCGAILKKGVKVSILVPIDENEKYIMCIECADKNTKIVNG